MDLAPPPNYMCIYPVDNSAEYVIVIITKEAQWLNSITKY